ncbi:MAG: hypothetical protein HRT90_03100 [Candidatus Margulisbacteria bacterium]|nr:hypothetical protein [Candidatus Margulisiibacteriota bacterium]
MSRFTLQMIKNIKETKTQEFKDLKEECRQESYAYFHAHIRPLPKNKDGSFDENNLG